MNPFTPDLVIDQLSKKSMDERISVGKALERLNAQEDYLQSELPDDELLVNIAASQIDKAAAEAISDIRRQNPNVRPAKMKKSKLPSPRLWLPFQLGVDLSLNGEWKNLTLLKQMLIQMYHGKFCAHANINKEYKPIAERLNNLLLAQQNGKEIEHTVAKENLPDLSILWIAMMEIGLLKKGETTKSGRNLWNLSCFPMEPRKKWFYAILDEAVPGFVDYCKDNKIQIKITDRFNFAVPESVFEHFNIERHWEDKDAVVQNNEPFVTIENITLTTY